MLAEKGLWPVAGGSLDQAHWFEEAAELVWAVVARFRAWAADGARNSGAE
jgi:hypothetical protein